MGSDGVLRQPVRRTEDELERCPAPAKRTGGVAQTSLMCHGLCEKRIIGGITTFTHVSIVCGLNNANDTD